MKFPTNPKIRALDEFVSLGCRPFLVHGIRRDGTCTCGRSTCTSAGKHPHSRGWNRELPDLRTIRDQLLREPELNVGVLSPYFCRAMSFER